LREEGASNRDIQDAELALEEARQEVANASEDIVDAEDELQRAREGASARELADAEEAVADALRDTERAYDDIIDKEQQVADIRNAIANDTAYLDAERDLLDARDDVADATAAVADAEEALRDARDFGIARALRDAELDLMDAIYASAAANAEARIAQLRMNGVYVDAGTEAAILAEELAKLGKLAPTAAQSRRLREYIDLLNSAPESGPPVDSDIPTFDDVNFDVGETPLPLAPNADEYASGFQDFANQIPGATREIWRELWDQYGVELGKAVLVAIVGGILAAVFGIPLLVGGAIAGVALLIAELFGDDIVKFMTDKVGPAITNFFTSTLPDFFSKTIPKAFFIVVQMFGNFFTKELPDFLTKTIPQAFVGLLQYFLETGAGMVRSLIQGLWEVLPEVFETFGSIVDGIFDTFIGVGTWLFNAGWELLQGLVNGVSAAAIALFWFFITLPGKLLGFLANIGSDFFAAGVAVIQGILSGLGAAGGFLLRYMAVLPDSLVRTVGDIAGWFYGVGVDIIRGILDGLYDFGSYITRVLMNFARDAWDAVLDFFGISSPSKEFYWIGKMLMFGLRDGVDKYGKVAADAAAGIAEDTLAAFNNTGIDQAISDLLTTEAARMNLAVGGTAAATAAAATQQAGTVINEGDTINLEAITTADPAAIVDEFMWAKMVRV
jgi:hypothetical protein